MNIQFDETKPSWTGAYFWRNKLSDETEYLNYGQESVSRTFTELQWANPQPSSWTAFPTEEDPDALYKFFSIDLYVSLDSIVTERETYSLLEWLGDIGGLVDAFRYLGGFIVAPIASFSLQSELLHSIFKKNVTHQKPNQVTFAP